MTRNDYRSVRDEAQKQADALGFDFGIEKDAFGYRAFMLPRRENRYGHELRCEVVHCSNLKTCQPGHGAR